MHLAGLAKALLFIVVLSLLDFKVEFLREKGFFFALGVLSVFDLAHRVVNKILL